MFNFEESEISSAIKWDLFPLFRFAKFFRNLFLGLMILSLFFVGLSFIGSFSLLTALRLFILFLVFYIIFFETGLFYNQKVKNPVFKNSIQEAIVNPENFNLAEFLNFESAKIVRSSLKFCERRKVCNVSAMALLYFLLDQSQQARYICFRLGIDVDGIKHNLKNNLETLEKDAIADKATTLDFDNAIIESLNSAQRNKHDRIEPIDLLVGVSRAEIFKDILVQDDLKIEDFDNMELWYNYLENRIRERKAFWGENNLAAYGSLGKDWASGYTITLDQYSVDLREMARNWFYKAIIGHEREIEQVQMALTRPDINNVLIVGEPGIGKESIVEGLARRIYLGNSLSEINFFRVVMLDMVAILTRAKGPEEVESILDRIFNEAITAGNIILVIKDLYNYIGVDITKPGMVDISAIIGKYLKMPNFRFIGLTDFSGLHTRIESNPTLLELFNKVEVGEVSEMETIRILQNTALELEHKYKVFITYPSIRELVALSARYIPSVPFPKKAIDLLQDVAVYVARSKASKIITPEDIAKVVSTKTSIPVGKIGFQEKEVLLNMENLIHERLVNQVEAVKEISIAMRRARSGIGSKKRPMGSFLFLGPTGVGKTETSKALAQIYFGGEERMIRLDMSEFQSVNDIPRLLGAIGQEGLLTTPVRDNPFSLVLLDEIEKAHPNILNLFLQVLDEGNITDGQGRKVVFANTIIICTSNAGAEKIFEAVEKNQELKKDVVLNFLFDSKLFRPEFINRFDATVLFHPLTKENLLEISSLALESLRKNLKDKDIDFIITDALKAKIVELSYKPAFGAREMRRAIQDNVENVIAQALLSDTIKKGQSFEMSADNFSITVIEKPRPEANPIIKNKKVKNLTK